LKPLALISCGPASSPIDDVRRITNFSTGEIGVVLSGAFQSAGFDVVCFRGEGATFPAPDGVDVRPFSTNESLDEGFRTLGRQPDVVLHAAALCDFSVLRVEGADASRKISSRAGTLRIILEPAPKILPLLREWFPGALLVGWKYEMDGSRSDALEKGAAQLREAHTDACIVNGAAFGPGFGMLLPGGELEVLPDKSTLSTRLAEWATVRPPGGRISDLCRNLLGGQDAHGPFAAQNGDALPPGN